MKKKTGKMSGTAAIITAGIALSSTALTGYGATQNPSAAQNPSAKSSAANNPCATKHHDFNPCGPKGAKDTNPCGTMMDDNPAANENPCMPMATKPHPCRAE